MRVLVFLFAVGVLAGGWLGWCAMRRDKHWASIKDGIVGAVMGALLAALAFALVAKLSTL